ncbi:fluoride efflux transporter FluC [Arthrobacter cavernae]|uniref:Fluoride-specific ion channel FluC n=1 Tax=Arthrobacter cavernae TaxID=2817681 RepID=A0A939HBN9_9MICC|nr:CrcB family protein [Arthrobacter cavernae]MBO1267879.1 CrcB family protein [Arthrobacter cavernae]
MTSVLLTATVLLSGAVAATVRYLVTVYAVRSGHNSLVAGFPYPVLVVNAIGSIIAGTATGATAHGMIPPELHIILVTGVAGGLTTFSTLSVETIQLLMRKRYRTAISSMAVNLLTGFTLALAGYGLGLLL